MRMPGSSVENVISIFLFDKEYKKLDIEHAGYCHEDDEEKIDNELKTYTLISDISEKIRNAMCFLRSKSKTKIDNKLSSIFYIWLGNKMIDVVNNDDEFNSYISNCYKILNTGYDADEFEKPVKAISRDNFRKIKLFHDYSLHHDIIKFFLEQKEYSCSSDFKEYLQDAVSTYIQIYRECTSTTKNDYCEIYEKIKAEYPNIKNELNTLVCKENIAPAVESPLSTTHESEDSLGSESVLLPSGETRYESYKYIFITLLPVLAFIPVAMWLIKLFRNNEKLWQNIKEIWREKFEQNLFQHSAPYYDSNVFKIPYFT
ncbi:variable surface protein [Plasmodium gonderi]|uniref:Variable surface protein n=1 Tax=Plasmodium gonderi TaxID=77519 RepID=A0A1Y1JPS9_PLAGO|nr:variable surface protein [Plasmodium gonderi]GAW84481.1 variable surface protein [Plasmodium gonderi]